LFRGGLPFAARQSCIGCRGYQEANVSSLPITSYIYDTHRLAVGARFSPNFFVFNHFYDGSTIFYDGMKARFGSRLDLGRRAKVP